MAATNHSRDGPADEHARFRYGCPNCGMADAVQYGDTFECNGCGRTVAEPDLRSVVRPGQKVRVHIDNTAPIGGATQFEEFTVESRTWDRLEGTDETWGDAVTVERDGTDLALESGAKAGDVVRIETLETTDDGVPIHGSETVVYRT